MARVARCVVALAMANGITTATPDDRAIQAGRYARVFGRLARQQVGYCVGWGFESDYVGANNMLDATRYSAWLRGHAIFNGRTHAINSS